MTESNEDSVVLYNLRVIIFNWLPAFGCLAVGVVGFLGGMRELDRVSTGGGLYLIAGALGFGLFGGVWRR
jgi:hypothetical protein